MAFVNVIHVVVYPSPSLSADIVCDGPNLAYLLQPEHEALQLLHGVVVGRLTSKLPGDVDLLEVTRAFGLDCVPRLDGVR